MCDPITAAVMSVASVGMQYSGARAQAKHQTQLHELNKQQAHASAADQYQGLGLQEAQNNEAASNDVWTRRMLALQEQSTANVAAAEGGVSGFSVERVLRDIGSVASRDISTIEQNRDWSNDQLQQEALGVRSQTQDRIMSVQKGTKPNPWSYVFKAGTDGFTSYNAAKRSLGSKSDK